MIHDALKATAIALFGLMLRSAATTTAFPIAVPSEAAVITPQAGSDAPALPAITTIAAPQVAQEAGQADGVSSSQLNTSFVEISTTAEVWELRERVAELEAEIARLNEPKFTEPAKPVVTKSAQPVSYQTYSSCANGNCDTGRRRLFGRRR